VGDIAPFWPVTTNSQVFKIHWKVKVAE